MAPSEAWFLTVREYFGYVKWRKKTVELIKTRETVTEYEKDEIVSKIKERAGVISNTKD